MDLTTQTPVEIDTQIAAIYVRFYAQQREVNKVANWLTDVEDRLAIAKGEKKSYYRTATERDIPSLEGQIAGLVGRLEIEQAKAADIMRETAPFNAEFKARGGWSRFYLVDNAGGHVHSSMGCSTCYPTTEFIWLPEESGQDEAEIVVKANEQACTVCFPSAPVDRSRKGIYEAPARKAAREEREAKKAATLAKKQAKALFPEDIEKVYKTEGKWGDRLGTVAAAKSFLTDGAQWGWNHPSYQASDRDQVAEILANRLGTTAQEEVAAAHKRAQKRR